MSNLEEDRPRGGGNDRALKAWGHLTTRLGTVSRDHPTGFAGNIRRADTIALNLIRRNRRSKRG